MNLKSIYGLSVVILLVFLYSCTGSGNKNQQSDSVSSVEVKSEPVKLNPEAQALLDYLAEKGDYVNSRQFPSLINASAVYEQLDSNIVIIDLRGEETFKKGHIKNAINVKFSNLPAYFSNDIKPEEYDKIILVCYAGQIASYSTLLLRLMGYNNVYAMKWGMSGWNKDFAEDWWLKILSSKHEDQLEKNDKIENEKSDFPVMNTGKTGGKEIFDARIKNLFDAGMNGTFILADSVFTAPDRYYIMNYIRKDKYESGHIPGAVRYKPNGTLGMVDEMETIPTNKKVVVYCETGHQSGFVTAYLKLFGYDAHSLIYGNNAFMHDKMLAEKNTLSWMVFSEDEIMNFPYVKN